MSRKEKIKENLGNYNIYLAGLVNLLIALIGFTFSTVSELIKTPFWISIMGFCGIFIVAFSIYLLQRKMTKLQDELGGL